MKKSSTYLSFILHWVLPLLLVATLAGCGDDSDEDTEAEANQNNLIAAPTLRSPVNGAEIDPDSPVVDWFNVQNAVSFQVEISKSETFDIVEIVNEIPATSYMISDFILDEGPHFWRVRARNSQGAWSDWSSVSSFIVVTGGKKSHPVATIVKPAADTTVFLNGNVHFLGEVAADENMQYNLVWDFGSLGTVEDNIKPWMKFTAAGTYVVKLTSWDSFDVQSTDQVVIEVSEATPALKEPTSGTTVTGNTVQFIWEPVKGAVSYILSIPSINPEIIVNDTKYTYSGLADGTYEWCVYAVDSEGNRSTCSSSGHFIVKAG